MDERGSEHHDLGRALAAMRWRLVPGRFVLCGFEGAPGPADLALVADAEHAALVREPLETSLLVAAEHLPELRARHRGARFEEGLVWIRFEAPMAWDLVGFLALVTGRLAQAGVPLGVVCSFRRDHLFVGESWLPRARSVLGELLGPPLEAPPAREGVERAAP